LILTPMDDFKRLKTSVKEVTTDMVDITRELQVEPENLNCYKLIIKQMRSCFLWMSKESGFLRWFLLLVKML